jgi:dynactin complex subunit
MDRGASSRRHVTRWLPLAAVGACCFVLALVLRVDEADDLRQLAEIQERQSSSMRAAIDALKRELNLTQAAMTQNRGLLDGSLQLLAAVKGNLTEAVAVLQESRALAADLGPQLTTLQRQQTIEQERVKRCRGFNAQAIAAADEKAATLRERAWRLTQPRLSTPGAT